MAGHSLTLLREVSSSSGPIRWAGNIMTFQPGDDLMGRSPASSGETVRHFASEKGSASVCPPPNWSVEILLPSLGSTSFTPVHSPEDWEPSHFLGLNTGSKPVSGFCPRA